MMDEANSPSDEEELTRLEAMRKSLLAQLQDGDGEEDEDDEENGREEINDENFDKLDESTIMEEEKGASDEEEENREEEQSYSDEDAVDGEENSWMSDNELLEEEMVEVVNSEQIDNLLENPVDEQSKDLSKTRPMIKKRKVLEFRATDHFNVLPDGWIELTHHKKTRVCTFARPYFIGRSSIQYHRVPESAIPCLFQKKYQEEMEKIMLVKESTQQDNCPNSSNGNDATEKHDTTILSRLNGASVKVETEVESNKKQLTPDQLYEYAKNRLKFKDICVFKFKKWDEKRKFHKRRRMRQVLLNHHKETAKSINGDSNTQRPGISNGMKLITIPALDADVKPNKRPFCLNPHGKTSVSILHEFVQKALKCSVRYFFSEARNSTTPFHCAVKLVLNNSSHSNFSMVQNNGKNFGQKNGQLPLTPISIDVMRQRLAKLDEFNDKNRKQLQSEQRCPFGNGEYKGENKSLGIIEPEDSDFITLGEAFGPGKKNAKLFAAKNALDKLVPSIDFDTDMIAISSSSLESEQLNASMASTSALTNGANASLNDSAQIFDLIGVTDTRIPELCARAGQPSPYLILQEYLKRYSAFGDTQINLTSTRHRHGRHLFHLTVGEHSVEVISRNKRDGKQMAAQALLKKLHPQNENWGSLLRLYGYEAQQKFREARKSKDSVVKLQGIQPDDSKSIGKFQPNALILDKLHAYMLKLSEKLLPNQEMKKRDEMPPPNKFRRVDFQADQPILSEEQLRKLSAKMAAEHPELQQHCLPSVRF